MLKKVTKFHFVNATNFWPAIHPVVVLFLLEAISLPGSKGAKYTLDLVFESVPHLITALIKRSRISDIPEH